MVRGILTSLLLVASVAEASELPPSARALVPAAWSVPAPEPVGSGDWVLAVGGDGLVGLVARVDEVAAVATADAQRTQARGASLQAAAGWLPQASASAAWTTGTPNGAFAAVAGGAGSMDQYSASADLVVPLVPWTAVPDQRAARADVQAADADLVDARADAALALTAAWLDLAQAEAALRIVEDQLAVQTELLALTEARYAGAEVAGVDVLQQRQQLAATEADRPAAQADVGRARRAVAALLRVDAAALPTPPEGLPEPVLPPLPSPRDLVEGTPAVQSAVHGWEAARSRTRSARASLLPDLRFTASTGVRYTELVDTALTPTWSAGLQASVPLFDGGATFGRVRSASGAETASLVAVEQAVVDTVQQVEDALALWDQAAAVRGAADRSEQLALESLEAARAGYAAGTSTYTTVLTAQQTARTARQTALQAQRDHVDAALEVVSRVRGAWAVEENG